MESKDFGIYESYEKDLQFDAITETGGVEGDNSDGKYYLSYYEFASKKDVDTLEGDMNNPGISKLYDNLYVYSNEEGFIVSYIAFAKTHISIVSPYSLEGEDEAEIMEVLKELGFNIK